MLKATGGALGTTVVLEAAAVCCDAEPSLLTSVLEDAAAVCTAELEAVALATGTLVNPSGTSVPTVTNVLAALGSCDRDED